MLGSWIEQVIAARGYGYPFVHVDSIMRDAELVFVNLEAPFGKGDSAFDKEYAFRVSSDLVQVLKAGRINVVSLANNHIMDFGFGALRETMDLLRRNEIGFSGAGANLAEARKPALFEVKGIRVAVASYSLTFPEEFWATDTTAGTCFPSHTFVYRDIRKLKQENHLVILSFHWSAELLKTPKEYQVDLAHRAIDAGADLILGHHPHVIQGIELYRGKIIAYSLGNFVFGSYSESARESMLLKLKIGRSGIKSFQVVPLNVYNKEVEFQPQLLSGEPREKFFMELSELSRELNDQPLVFNTAGWMNL